MICSLTQVLLSTNASAQAYNAELIKWTPSEANAAFIYSVTESTAQAYQDFDFAQIGKMNPQMISLFDQIDLKNLEILGINLKRGIALFLESDQKALRFVLSIDDWSKFEQKLKAAEGTFQGAIQISQDHATLGSMPFQCVYTDRQLVCDNSPFKKGPIPIWAQQLPQNSTFWIHAQTTETLAQFLVSKIGQVASAISHITISAVNQEDDYQIVNEIKFTAKFNHPMIGMLASTPEAKALAQAHANSGVVLHIGLPVALKGLLMTQLTQAPALFTPVLTSLLKAMNGEVQLSFAGGYHHPMLSLGSTSDQRAQELLSALVQLDELNQQATPEHKLPFTLKLDAQNNGISKLILSFMSSNGNTNLSFDLFTVVHEGVMHFTLFEADLKRLIQGKQGTKLPFPSSFENALLAFQMSQPFDGLLSLFKILPMINFQKSPLSPKTLQVIMHALESTYHHLFDVTIGAFVSSQEGLSLKIISRSFKESK